MGPFNEFRIFAMRGNVIDLAVGVIIGAAFGMLVTSLVQDILMPPIGYLMGGVDFSSFSITLVEARGETEAVVIRWGKFVNAIIAFLIQAVAVFMLIKVVNTATRRFQAQKVNEPAAKPADVLVLEEIRDLLAKQHT